MLQRLIVGLTVAVLNVPSAFAHTTEALHPHPHSMELASREGAAVVALMLVTCGLLIVAHNLASSNRTPIENSRGHQ